MKKYVCGWCGKYSYTSRNAARDAVRKMVKDKGLQECQGSFYRCESDRKVFHITSWNKDRTERYQKFIRNTKPRDLENSSPILPSNQPVSENRYWRWIIFDTLSRFGVKSAKTIKLPPSRWGGIVNRSPWAVPATVTVFSRKRNRRRKKT